LRKENIPVVLLTFMCDTFCQGTDFLGGFLQIVWFPPKLTATISNEYFEKKDLNSGGQQFHKYQQNKQTTLSSNN
jgi:hypothetical protein